MTLCLLAGTSAFAQDRRAPRTKERPTAEQMAQRKTDRMVEKLNLNEDQSKQLYELNRPSSSSSGSRCRARSPAWGMARR